MLKSRIAFLPLFVGLVLVAGCSGLFIDGNFLKLSVKINDEVIEKDAFIHHTHQVKFIDHSPTTVNEWFETVKTFRSKLYALDRKDFKEGEHIAYDILSTYLNRTLLLDSFRFHNYPITHLNGPHLDAIQLLRSQKLTTKKDAEQYLEILETIESNFGGLIDGLELRREAGIVLPTFILEKVISQCDSLGSKKPEEHLVFVSLQQKLNASQNLNLKTKAEVADRAKVILSESVIPAYKRLAAYLRQLEHKSLSIAGVWQHPKGNDYYRQMLQYYAGAKNDPMELFEIGKMQLSAIEGELLILEKMSVSTDTVRDASATNRPQSTVNSEYPFRNALPFPAYNGGIWLIEQQISLSSLPAVEPVQKLQFLLSEQLATTKMMIDIGIHHKQWLHEQAVRFLINHSQLSETNAKEMVDGIVVRPGLESAAKIGFMRLLELQAGQDGNQFLNQIRTLGPMQLNTLEKHLQNEATDVNVSS